MTIMEAAPPQEQIAAMLRSCGEFAKENIVLGELKAFSMCAHGPRIRSPRGWPRIVSLRPDPSC